MNNLKYFLLLFSFVSFSQESTLINKLINSKNDTIHLINKFIIPEKDFQEVNFFNKNNFEFSWNSYSDKNLPSIDLFLDNFNLNHLRLDLELSKTDTIINFSGLNKKIRLSTSEDIEKHKHNTYIFLSKPIFNCSKNWAIIIKSSYIPYVNQAGGGELYIYRKIKNEWTYYHNFNLWVN